MILLRLCETLLSGFRNVDFWEDFHKGRQGQETSHDTLVVSEKTVFGYQLDGTSSHLKFVVLQEVEACEDANRNVEAKTLEPKVSSSSKHGVSGAMIASQCLVCVNWR